MILEKQKNTVWDGVLEGTVLALEGALNAV
jgi:hypothetical protein